MAKFAPTVPINIARYLARSGDLGYYHLLLAHDVVKCPANYRELYNRDGMTIIMDNSICELGSAVGIDLVVDACKIVRPTTIVLPDVYLDSRGTIESCSEALATWYEKLSPILGNHRPDWGFMMVPQGQTIYEFIECAESFADGDNEKMGLINYWGVPRNLVDNLGTRRDAIEIVRTLNPYRDIHLLGFSDEIHDDVLSARHPQVMGIDSAVPVRAASLGFEMSMSMHLPPRKTQVDGKDWWDHAEPIPLMIHNTRTIRKWIR